MMIKESFLFLFAVLSVPSTEAAGKILDKNYSEECDEIAKAGKCIQDSETFYKCGLSCSQHYDPGDLSVSRVDYEDLGKDRGNIYKLNGMIQGDMEEFFELQVDLDNGKKLSMEHCEGMVIIVAVVPLIPGMAQYYFDMLDQIKSLFPYTIEIIVIRVVANAFADDDELKNIALPPNSKVHLSTIVNDRLDESLELIHYIEQSIPPEDKRLGFDERDRVNLYVVGISGLTAKMLSPTKVSIEKLIKFYTDEMKGLHAERKRFGQREKGGSARNEL